MIGKFTLAAGLLAAAALLAPVGASPLTPASQPGVAGSGSLLVKVAKKGGKHRHHSRRHHRHHRHHAHRSGRC